MVHDDYKQMIPAQALSALDTAEERALNDHLATCAECQQELLDWQQTTAALALGAAPVEPSPLVRQRILSEIRSEDRLSPKVLPFKTPERNLWSSFGSLGAIAATIVFVALLVYAVLLWQENRAMRRETQLLRAEIGKTQEELKLVKLLSTPGARLTELSGTSVAPGAMAKLAYDRTGHAMVMTKGLPAAPPGKEYQLWFIMSDKPPMRGSTFSTDSHGNGMIEDQVPAAAMNAPVFAVTLEPKGGSDSPTMPIYLRS